MSPPLANSVKKGGQGHRLSQNSAYITTLSTNMFVKRPHYVFIIIIKMCCETLSYVTTYFLT